jgi:hypothetical protein
VIPKEAIDRAKKGGWREPLNGWINCDLNVDDHYALDPTFWKCLGKALRWEKKIVIRRGTLIGNFCTPCTIEHPCGECFKEMGFGMDYLDAWAYYAHRFYDIILTQTDTKPFWDELLK